MNAPATDRTTKGAQLPDLDVVVLEALEFFEQRVSAPITINGTARPVVVGSGNAAAVGRLLFEQGNAYFADESTFATVLAAHADIDGVIVVSASGSKHANAIVSTAINKGLPTYLLTANAAAPAAELLPASHVHVFPHMREPYTYNVSTYLGMLLSHSQEEVSDIRALLADVARVLPDTLGTFDAFFLTIPPAFESMRSMFSTKFDELFGPKLVGRVFTLEQAKHAKTVVPSATECFISFGTKNELFGKVAARVHVPLPYALGPAGMMAAGYFVIGHIQRQHPPYFKDHIVDYVEAASEMFQEKISIIVE